MTIHTIIPNSYDMNTNADKGMRNDPRTIPRGVAAIALSKGLTVEETRHAIRHNFKRLFNQ